jgi:uncharacterized protein
MQTKENLETIFKQLLNEVVMSFARLLFNATPPRKIAAIALLSLLLSGCGGIMTQNPNFYLLTPLTPSTEASSPSPLLVSLKPVETPKYLVTSRIMTLRGDNQLEQAAAHLWAEPLEDNFTRVLAANLATRLGQKRVYIYPHNPGHKPDIVIDILVEDFLGNIEQGVTLRAHWNLSTNKGAPLHSATSSITQKVIGTQYYDLVTAMSKTTARLADEISAVLIRHSSSGKDRAER